MRCCPSDMPSFHWPRTLLTADVQGGLLGHCLPLSLMHGAGFSRERPCRTTRQTQLESLLKKAEVSRAVFEFHIVFCSAVFSAHTYIIRLFLFLRVKQGGCSIPLFIGALAARHANPRYRTGEAHNWTFLSSSILPSG